jgi:hypothetical protein
MDAARVRRALPRRPCSPSLCQSPARPRSACICPAPRRWPRARAAAPSAPSRPLTQPPRAISPASPPPRAQAGLQLLLVQPSDSAVLALRAAALAAGTAAPAWLAYKAAQGGAGPKAKDRALRLAVATGALELAERGLLAPAGLARWRHWPAAKLAILLWLLLDGGKVRVRAAGRAGGEGGGEGRGDRPRPRLQTGRTGRVGGRLPPRAAARRAQQCVGAASSGAEGASLCATIDAVHRAI